MCASRRPAVGSSAWLGLLSSDKYPRNYVSPFTVGSFYHVVLLGRPDEVNFIATHHFDFDELVASSLQLRVSANRCYGCSDVCSGHIPPSAMQRGVFIRRARRQKNRDHHRR